MSLSKNEDHLLLDTSLTNQLKVSQVADWRILKRQPIPTDPCRQSAINDFLTPKFSLTLP